jgi:L-idonate 5-dehydrogenase
MKAESWISKFASLWVLGHEVAGEVVEIGRGVTKVSVGQRVAVNPLRACLRCVYCLSGHSNLCRNRRFCGSAARFPHVQGMFAELFISSEEQCVALPKSTPFRVAACAEPLGVTLHAVARAGAILGRKVLVTGSGPIGVLVAASTRLAGAAEIVVTDLFDEALAIASRMGATDVVNVSANESRLTAYMQDGGYFDVALEASGNPLGAGNLYRGYQRWGSDRASRYPARRAVGGVCEQISSKGIGTGRDIPF